MERAMLVTQRHPLDGVIADWGFLVRSIRQGRMNEALYRLTTDRIRAELTEFDPALGYRIGAVLDRLEQVEESGRMTPELFAAAADEVREALTVRRLHAKPFLVVLQGGLSNHNHQGA